MALNDASNRPEPAGLSRARERVLLIALVAAEITSSFEVSMIYAAMPTLVREFGGTASVGWLITAYLLVGAVSAALGSRLGDMLGRRRLVLLLLGVAVVGSTISALSSTLTGQIVGRGIQGFSAALMPLCIGLAREHLPPARVPVAVGWLAAAATFSAGIGLLLGGVLVDQVGWRSIFVFSASYALLAWVVVAWVVPPSKATVSAQRFDLLGGVLFAPAIAGVLWAITRVKLTGLGDPLTASLLAGGLVLLAVWFRHEWTHDEPMIDVRQLRDRQIGLTMLAMATFAMGTAQLMLVLMMLVQQPVWTGVGLGLTATAAAAIKLPSNFAGLFGAPWSGYLAARHGARRAAVIGACIILASWIGMLVRHDGAAWLVGWALMSSFGGAMLYAAMPNLIVERVAPERTSEANGMLQLVRTIAAAVGTQLISVLLASDLVSDPAAPGVAHPSSWAYLLAMGTITLLCGLCVLSAYLLPHRGGVAGRKAAAA